MAVVFSLHNKVGQTFYLMLYLLTITGTLQHLQHLQGCLEDVFLIRARINEPRSGTRAFRRSGYTNIAAEPLSLLSPGDAEPISAKSLYACLSVAVQPYWKLPPTPRARCSKYNKDGARLQRFCFWRPPLRGFGRGSGSGGAQRQSNMEMRETRLCAESAMAARPRSNRKMAGAKAVGGRRMARGSPAEAHDDDAPGRCETNAHGVYIPQAERCGSARTGSQIFYEVRQQKVVKATHVRQQFNSLG